MIYKKIWVSLKNDHLIIHLVRKNGTILSIADNYTGQLETATIDKNGKVKILNTYNFREDIKI